MISQSGRTDNEIQHQQNIEHRSIVDSLALGVRLNVAVAGFPAMEVREFQMDFVDLGIECTDLDEEIWLTDFLTSRSAWKGNLLALFVKKSSKDEEKTKAISVAATNNGIYFKYIDSIGDISKALLALFSTDLKVNVAENRSLKLEAASIRQLLDDNQRAFARLERYLSSHNLTKCERRVQTGFSNDYMIVPSYPLTCKQELPGDLYGLCAIVLKAKCATSLNFRVRLFSGDDAIATWHIQNRQTSDDGIIRLELDRCDEEQYNIFYLEIATDPGHETVFLALSNKLAPHRFAALSDSKRVRASIAWELWYGVPGVRNMRTIDGISTEADRGNSLEYIVSSRRWSDSDYDVVAREDLKDSVHPVDDYWLQAHPAVNKATLILYKGLVIKQLKKVYVPIRNAHPHAPECGFQVGLIAFGETSSIYEITDSLATLPHYSETIFLKGGEESELEFCYPEIMDGHDLVMVLLTKCAQSTEAYAWCQWGTMRFSTRLADEDGFNG